MFRKVLLLGFLIGIPSYSEGSEISEEWWRNTFIYQIYPRSFKDSNGDGIGDLNGITSKLEYLADLNVSAVWISSFYASPMVDFGYDISNFTDVDPIFGNLDDFSKLMSKAKSLNLKIILDFVPNHSSDKCEWFKKSVKKIKPYDEYYIWKDAKIINGTRHPPNNWLSAFQGSAWNWNDERQQYYYHAFAAGQPDFNWRNPAVREEMNKVLLFWLDRGVDGFRIDTVNNLIENADFLDDPVNPNSSYPHTDDRSLFQIYSKDQSETYKIHQSWRHLLDSYPGEKKILMTEAYTKFNYVMKYFDYGSNVPFNFMLILSLNKNSSALMFKRAMDRYLDAIPDNQTPNWVTGNHDQGRVASRFGRERVDQLTMIAAVMPGVVIAYNGDEIGMENRQMSWKETIDPAGCNAGPERYNITSRDPQRTPFQWDDTTSAGFSTSNRTWLPVHPNYKLLNLAAQKRAHTSHYSIFKDLVTLKKTPVVSKGTTQIIIVGHNVLGVVRRLKGYSPIVLLINFNDVPTLADAESWMNVPEKMMVYVASIGSTILAGSLVDTNKIALPAAASIILV